MPREILGITVYSTQETAELLDLTTKSVLDYIATGKIKAKKIGGKWFITEEAIRNLITGRTIKKQPQDTDTK